MSAHPVHPWGSCEPGENLAQAPDLSNLIECEARVIHALEAQWEATFQLWDLAALLVSRFQKPELKAIMDGIGRSHQDLYRWAAYAKLERPADESPQTIVKKSRRG